MSGVAYDLDDELGGDFSEKDGQWVDGDIGQLDNAQISLS